MGFVLARAAVHGMLLEMNTSDASRPIGIRVGGALAASLAAVSLAAGCGSSTSTPNAASSSASTSSPSSSTTTAAAASSATSAASSATSSAASASESSSLPPKPTSPGPGGPGDCSTDMLKLTIEPLREPINHVMIEAKNISQLPCHLNKYPMLRTYQAQPTPIPAAEATKPASAIVLLPGASAYAGVMTSAADGSGTSGKNIPALLLQLQPSAGGGGVGRPASVAMPPGSQYIDSAAVVTYWESDVQTATY